MGEFFLGVGASMASALLIYALRYQVSGLVNLIFAKVYPRISGNWSLVWYHEYTEQDDEETNTYLVPVEDEEKVFVKMKIKQFANRVKGTIETIENGKVTEIDEVKGKVTASRVVILNTEAKTEGHHNYGSFLLKMSANSKKMHGYCSALCTECQETSSWYSEFEKE